jgi:hypothetical protein
MRKRGLRIGSAVLGVASLAAVGVIFTPAASKTTSTEQFTAFPLDHPTTISLAADEPTDLIGAHENLDEQRRHWLDQARDWALLAALQSSGAPPKEINESTYDMPIIRNESLRRVATFEYGPVRSRVLGNGQVVALVPQGPDSLIKDYLGHIADAQRTNLSAIPASVIWFQYELNPEAASASVTRRATIPGDRLFTEAYGYYERDLHSRDDLNAFLEGVDDLTWVQVSKDSLRAGGRRRFTPPAAGEQAYGRISLQDVAAIYRGQQGLEETRGCGFSLDPRVDMAKASVAFYTHLAPTLEKFLAKPETVVAAREIMQAKVASPKDAMVREQKFREALVAACESSSNPVECIKFLNDIIFSISFQTARYEGQHLGGTEVGMVLFYTDLLMKLWSFDFEGSAPRQHIQGFPIETEMHVSPVYRNEVDRAPASRLWLGPLRPAYLISERDGAVYFARNATRVFAHAHSFVADRDSAEDPEPNILTRLFIDWWNDHFEEIARYEPQYERLNQIMKWGVVTSWLESRRSGGLLWFLADTIKNPIPVVRVDEFPIWARKNSGLAFHDWGSLKFDKPSEARAENESLDLVSSKNFDFFGKKLYWQGGVEMASRATVEESAAAARGLEDVTPSARRAALNGNVSRLAAGRLEDIRATEYVFNNYSERAVSTLVRARPSERLRTVFGELENVGFNRGVRSTSDSLLFQARAESERVIGDLGALRISNAPQGIEVRWISRDIDLGQSLGQRVSTANDAGEALAKSPDVDAVLSLDDERSWLVKSRRSDQWIKLTEAPPDAMVVSPGYQARVAGIGEHSKAIDVGWFNKGEVEIQLRESGYVSVLDSGTRGGARLQYSARPPPVAAKVVKFQVEGIRLDALQDAAGRKWIKVGDLPKPLRVDITRLAGVRPLGPEELDLARHLEAGEYRDVAQQLARDPATYRAHWNRLLEDEIAFNDRLILERQYRLALDHATRVLAEYGRLPDFAYRKALLECVDHPDRAAGTLGTSFPGRLTHPEKFYDEVNFRIENAANPVERENAETVARFADWEAQPERPGSITPITENGHLHIHLKVTEIPDGHVLPRVEAEAVLAEGRPIYIADRPGLVDPNVPLTTQSLHQLISTGRFTLRELQLADVAHFQPQVITAPAREAASTADWRLLETGTRSVSQYHQFEPKKCDDKKENCQVYVLDTAEVGTQ